MTNGERLPPPALPPPGPVVAARVPTNGFAITSLVLGILGLIGLWFVGPILALVFGYLARGQIDRSGGRQEGRGLAVAGIIMGWIGIGLSVLWTALFVWFFTVVFPKIPFPTPTVLSPF